MIRCPISKGWKTTTSSIRFKNSELKKGFNPEKDAKEFLTVVGDIKKLGNHADSLLDIMIKAEENKFISGVLKIFK